MTKEQQQAISNSFARSVLFLQLSKIEFNAYKGQYPIPSLNHILGKGINGLNGTLNDLKRIGLRLCVCLPLAQCFILTTNLMGQIAQNRCYTLARLIKR